MRKKQAAKDKEHSLLLLDTELDTTSVVFWGNFFFVRNAWFTSCITTVTNYYEHILSTHRKSSLMDMKHILCP